MGNFGKKRSNHRCGGGSRWGNNQKHPTPPEIRRRHEGGTAVVAMEPPAVGGGEQVVVALNKGVHIHEETLKMKRDQQELEKYLFEFAYDAYVPGRVTFHFCCSKLGDEAGLTKEDDLIPSITVDLPRGFRQKFRQESGSGIDLSNAREEEVYILAIQAVAFASTSIDTSMDSGTSAFQYTQATFHKKECQVRVTYQSIHLNRLNYVLHDMHGIATDGRLLVFKKEIGKGSSSSSSSSNGTVVFEGIFQGCPVAVKRIVKVHPDVAAFKEIEKLISSDQHPNVVTYYCVKYDQDFVYIALERCVCSLDCLITPPGDSSVQQQPTIEVLKDLELWKLNQHPSPVLLRLMRHTIAGLAHLHKLGIIHRDLKPQNVLIRKDTFISANVSDMSISKLLPADKSSFTKSTTGIGSSGWQAPELLWNQRQTRAADLFSFGILLFFCITGGRHPFGDNMCERDINIKNNVKKNLDLVNHLPEAHDLINRLLHPKPKLRPTAAEVYEHPLFWDPETLSFLRQVTV